MTEREQPGTPESNGTFRSDPAIVVGIIADPGLPADVAAQMADALPTLLTAEVSDHVSWQVDVLRTSLVLNEHNDIPVVTIARRLMPARGWDYVIALTDLPRRMGTRPILSSLSTRNRTALVSIPAAGWLLRPYRHVRTTIVHLVAEMVANSPHYRQGGRTKKKRIGSRTTELASPIRLFSSPREDMETYLGLVGLRGRTRLLLGMVRANRPWRLVPSLSSALAAAAATAAFGVFYGSIWAIADALSPLRLALINAFALFAMVIWLIAYNNLWERPSGRPAREEAVLYNIATICTLGLGVACMYVLLFVTTLLGVWVVIDAQLLESEVGHPVGVAEYIAIAWLASSMGTVAGALGSSFEDEEAVREAAYSRRERERRARLDDSDDQDGSESYNGDQPGSSG